MMKKIIPLLWLAAVFLAIFSSKLLLIEQFGSALPLWDQWAAEAWGLYIPFFEHKLFLQDLFAAHCEHRIFLNRVLSLLLLVLNGQQWDPRLGMVLNAAITAGTGVALSAMGWQLLGRKNIALISLFTTLVFSLPFSWECSLLGFIGNYLLIALALLAIWFLVRHDFCSLPWLAGLFGALLSLVTMGSGFCAAAAALAIILLRAILRRGRPGRDMIAMAILIAVVLAGLYLRVNVPGHAAFQPANIHDFIISLGQNLAWPNFDLPWTAIIVWLPSLLVLAGYIFRRTDNRGAEFIIGFGLWIALQDAALAFSRSGTITSRHTVFLCLSLPINFLALLFLVRQRPLANLLKNFLAVIFIIWIGNTGYDLSKISGRSQLAEAVKFKNHLAQCEKNVRAFLQSDDIANLENKPLYDIPFPVPEQLAFVLRNPRIRAILPACVVASNQPGPLSRFVSGLIPKGDKLLIIAIGLMTILAGIRFYQVLGTLEKRLMIVRWPDLKRLLAQAGIILVIAALIFAAGKLYSFWSPYGLKVTYFHGMNFEQKICSRTEKAVCRDYDDKAPAWRVPREKFSALWQGILRVPETGEYCFFSQSDDGLRLIIDGNKIIDNWHDQSWGASGTGVQVRLTAGDHKIAVEHYNNEGEAVLRLKWSGGPIPANTILAAPYLRKY